MTKLSENELIKYCKEKLYYNPETGQLWRKFKDKTKLCDLVHHTGYLIVDIKIGKNGGSFLQHRIIFLMMNGSFPKLDIDHINNDPSDNRWCNLRECNSWQNGGNSKISIKNTSGYKGVCKDKNKWRAQIIFKRENIYLGNYDTKEEAAQAYNEAAIKLFGEFAKLNII